MKKIIFFILYCLGILRALAFLNRNKALILLYHGVSEEPIGVGVKNSVYLHIGPDDFKKQILYLKKRYNIISLQRLRRIISSGERLLPYTLVITFDDGYKNIFDNAYPLLLENKVKATVFLTSALMRDNGWLWLDKVEYAVDVTRVRQVHMLEIDFKLGDRQKKKVFLDKLRGKLKQSDECRRGQLMEELFLKLKIDPPDFPSGEYRLMSYREAASMSPEIIDFGSHTPGHTILPLEDDEKINSLLAESKQEISAELGRGIDMFSYPNGSYDSRVVGALKNNGFKCAVSTDKGFVGGGSDLFTLNRISIGAGDSFIPFIAHLSGVRTYASSAMQFLRKISRRDRKAA